MKYFTLLFCTLAIIHQNIQPSISPKSPVGSTGEFATPIDWDRQIQNLEEQVLGLHDKMTNLFNRSTEKYTADLEALKNKINQYQCRIDQKFTNLDTKINELSTPEAKTVTAMRKFLTDDVQIHHKILITQITQNKNLFDQIKNLEEKQQIIETELRSFARELREYNSSNLTRRNSTKAPDSLSEIVKPQANCDSKFKNLEKKITDFELSLNNAIKKNNDELKQNFVTQLTTIKENLELKIKKLESSISLNEQNINNTLEATNKLNELQACFQKEQAKAKKLTTCVKGLIFAQCLTGLYLWWHRN